MRPLIQYAIRFYTMLLLSERRKKEIDIIRSLILDIIQNFAFLFHKKKTKTLYQSLHIMNFLSFLINGEILFAL